MEPLVDIVIEDPRWQGILEPAAGPAAAAALAALGLPAQGFQICVMGCDDARIAGLNADFRGKPRPTNVLSWPAEDRASEVAGQAPQPPAPGAPEDPAHLGDIALAWETCAAEAEGQGKSLAHHAAHLVVHATLHLLGYDHEDDADAELMEAAEIRILAGLGIADPYA